MEYKDIEVIEGVVAVIDGKGWGVEFNDGHTSSYNFVNLNNAEISNPKYCKKPEDKVHKGHHYERILMNSKLVKVRRTIITEIIED